MTTISRLQPPSGARSLRSRINGIDWPVVTGILAMHLGCLLAPFFFTWTALIVTVLLVWLTGGIGITLCFHRLLTHRSFRSPKWFEYLLTLCGCMAWQGPPVTWVGVHRIHHRHSDESEDPHSPKDGFAWSHMFWCMSKNTDGQRAADAAKDLQRDAGMRLISRFFWIPQFVAMPLLFAGGMFVEWLGLSASGFSWLIWGVCVRTVIVYHGTWFVNSATHTWGYRNYETKDRSTNLWWVALLSFGEGWHNNHHAHQRSAAHGLRWFELDMTYWTIRLLGLLGLARDIVLPTADQRPGR
ncbi:MAG: acyl-CoA desaturase [Phycisphaeraceae bacterium]|nr:acyl-CoA desaturase [Phycisphaeraceae bacterium]